MKFLKILIASLLFAHPVFSQNASLNSYSTIDKIALAIPKSMTQSTDLIAKYINSNFKTTSEKTRAAFIWTASNVAYDTNYIFDTSENREDKIQRALKTRAGICENYAALFTEICNKLDIKSHVIEGYTKQNSVVSLQSHAWSACQIDEDWFLFDPTWGAGYVENGKFVPKVNNKYFRQNPENSIKSHMPFDYLWQFSKNPLNNNDFYAGNNKSSANRKEFDFNRALLVHEAQDYLGRLTSSAARVQENGLVNFLIKKQYSYLEKAIDNVHQNKVIALYNAAAAHYNQALKNYNDFVDFRNRSSNKSTAQNSMKTMVAKAEVDIINASKILKSLPPANARTTNAVNRLRKSVSSVNNDVQMQKQWLRNYSSSNKYKASASFNKRTASSSYN